MQDDENKANKGRILPLTPKANCQTINPAMATHETPRMTIRPQAEEHELVKKLQAKLGLKPGQIARLAIRRLAQAEGVTVRKKVS